MPSVQVRPEVNALTTPQSCPLRFIPRDTVGYDELAAEVAQTHPNYAQEDAKTIIMAAMERISAHLTNGNQVVLPDFFTFNLSFSAKLDSPDAPLPAGCGNAQCPRPCVQSLRGGSRAGHAARTADHD